MLSIHHSPPGEADPVGCGRCPTGRMGPASHPPSRGNDRYRITDLRHLLAGGSDRIGALGFTAAPDTVGGSGAPGGTGGYSACRSGRFWPDLQAELACSWRPGLERLDTPWGVRRLWTAGFIMVRIGNATEGLDTMSYLHAAPGTAARRVSSAQRARAGARSPAVRRLGRERGRHSGGAGPQAVRVLRRCGRRPAGRDHNRGTRPGALAAGRGWPRYASRPGPVTGRAGPRSPSGSGRR